MRSMLTGAAHGIESNRIKLRQLGSKHISSCLTTILVHRPNVLDHNDQIAVSLKGTLYALLPNVTNYGEDSK